MKSQEQYGQISGQYCNGGDILTEITLNEEMFRLKQYKIGENGVPDLQSDTMVRYFTCRVGCIIGDSSEVALSIAHLRDETAQQDGDPNKPADRGYTVLTSGGHIYTLIRC